MNNTIGKNVRLTLFGESHGKCVGAVLDGIPSGIPVNESAIAAALDARRPAGKISTARQERDEFQIMSGVFRGVTNGSPLCIIIPNADVKSEDYGDSVSAARPGHADYTSHVRNAGFEDFRGGGHFSGRLTAAIVAAGAVVISALEAKGICIGTHISSIKDVYDRSFDDVISDVKSLKNDPFPVLDEASGRDMIAAIEAARESGDSVGGTLESAICGLPAGVGDPWFDTVEGMLSLALFSIPAVKAVEFGAGTKLASMNGSESNDPFIIKDGKITTGTNNCGGILGGMTTGGDVLFRTTVKPTPTIYKKQHTVDLSSGEETTVSAKGRHDPCIVHRAASVQTAMAAIVTADLLAARYGEEWLRP
ncbi:MAG: chorismate synthase [Clostridia bacterium]|nr:chorismate synthase [Clostridia bacterium]